MKVECPPWLPQPSAIPSFTKQNVLFRPAHHLFHFLLIVIPVQACSIWVSTAVFFRDGQPGLLQQSAHSIIIILVLCFLVLTS
jgi:hypothetical protein